MKSRSPRPSRRFRIPDSRLDVPDRGDGTARAHRRGTRACYRRGARKASSGGALVSRNRAARNTIETAIIGGLERLGGFGGVADRLNCPTTTSERQTTWTRTFSGAVRSPRPRSWRSRAISSRQILAWWSTRLRVSRSRSRRVPRKHRPQARRARLQLDSRLMRTSRGASTFPRRGRRSRFNSPRRHQPYSNGLTLILSERRGLPIVAANLVIKTGSDANPIERPGLANFVAAMLDEGTASRNALQIADEVSQLGATLTTNSSMDATTISARSLSKNFAATLGLVADITLKPSFPAEEIDRQRASRLGQLVQMRDSPAQVAAQVMGLVLYGPKHPYGYGTGHRSVNEGSRARRDDGLLAPAFHPEQFGAHRRGGHLDERASGSRGEGVCFVAARQLGAAFAGCPRHHARPDRYRGQTGSTADAGSCGWYRGSPFVARFPRCR